LRHRIVGASRFACYTRKCLNLADVVGGVGALAATLASWVEACGFAFEGKGEIASVAVGSVMSAALTSDQYTKSRESVIDLHFRCRKPT